MKHEKFQNYLEQLYNSFYLIILIRNMDLNLLLYNGQNY